MTTRLTHQATPRATGRERFCTLCARWVTAALALGCLSPAWGQALLDPTRPPQAWLDAQQKGPPAKEEAAPELQSLVTGPSTKHAIIDGQLVGVGDTFRDARVMAVSPAGVVLQLKSGTQTLRLFPDVEKHPVKPVAADAGRVPAEAKRRVNIIGIVSDDAKEKK